MSISISPDTMSSTISQTQTSSRPPPPPGGREGSGPPSHASAIETLGGKLSSEVKDSLLASVAELEESGASFEEIKSLVDSTLESNGIDISGGQQRSGQLIDMMS